MKIGHIELGERPVFLAPMEDVTDIGFRMLCKRFGASMVYTEFVSAEALVRDVKSTVKKLVISDEERPVGIQIYGRDVDAMVEAAKIVEQAGPDVIDLNFGCPVKKVAGKGAGAGMLQNIPKMLEITQKVVDAVKVPVTAKTRLGWNHEQLIITTLAEQLQQCGIQALTIHGRTRSQMYTGEADWTLIGEVKRNPNIHIPIIGNGDIDSPQKAKEAFDKFGIDAIMIGRASIGAPWIFQHVKHYLATGELLPEPTIREQVEVIKESMLKSVEFMGLPGGVIHMRRQFARTFKGLENFRETRIKLLNLSDLQETLSLLDEIAEKWG
ncbi:MAG: tRNA dihydrouridine synthase DusB [Bacteroidales bacterium]|nr:tRNA dihydrouridine synthase DusB [Bacteroidales bacterium]